VTQTILSASYTVEKLLPGGDHLDSMTIGRHVRFRGFDPHGQRPPVVAFRTGAKQA